MGYYLQIWRCFFIFAIVSLTVLVPFFQLLRLDYQTGNGKGAHILAANTNETTFSLKLKTGHYLDPHQLTKIWLKCHVPVFSKICNQKQLQLAVHSIGTKSFLCFLEMNYGLSRPPYSKGNTAEGTQNYRLVEWNRMAFEDQQELSAFLFTLR